EPEHTRFSPAVLERTLPAPSRPPTPRSDWHSVVLTLDFALRIYNKCFSSSKLLQPLT
ncbi:Guanine nucleotide-binding protein alpha-1 subunit, partial [Dissostichus eleginoides]